MVLYVDKINRSPCAGVATHRFHTISPNKPPTQKSLPLNSYLIISSLFLFNEIRSLILHSDPKKPISSKHPSEWIRGIVYDIYENSIPLSDISNQLNILTTVHNILVRRDKEEEKKESRGRYPKSFKA